jgi:hypothetical protein
VSLTNLSSVTDCVVSAYIRVLYLLAFFVLCSYFSSGGGFCVNRVNVVMI